MDGSPPQTEEEVSDPHTNLALDRSVTSSAVPPACSHASLATSGSSRSRSRLTSRSARPHSAALEETLRDETTSAAFSDLPREYLELSKVLLEVYVLPSSPPLPPRHRAAPSHSR